ncbi:MAG: LysM peptidoglycan-binding domain-containing protein [Planctomycetaceae bacterium]
MGRETKLLLGFLGLLAGVFVGVLSMKLLVPRPPAGTGPDIRSESAVATAQERVEPPASAGGWDFAAAPPLEPDATAPHTSIPPVEPPRFSRFAAAPLEPPADVPNVTDGDVAPVSWQRVDASATTPAEAVAPPPVAPRDEPVATGPRDPFVTPPAPRSVPVAGSYLVQTGDSWWDVAERAYGDGRFYRALFAWNRSRDPRVSLAPGTRLEVPPLDRLAAAWPRLMPAGPR